jgi:hypothetical protein
MKPMYGVTHRPDGEPIVIEPRATKVGIGLPRGKAIHVYIDPSGQWCVQVGKEITPFKTRQEAVAFYRRAKADAPVRQYPTRVNYFLFNRVARDGSFEPDWAAIEAHGRVPTEISIVFTSDDPLQAGYQYWTASELKCEGDGVNASRAVSMASTPAEKGLAAGAIKKGERTFAIEAGCWLKGCPFSKTTVREGKEYPAPCRARGRLLFQLLAAPRLGGTAYFDTTGLRSISQLFSCLQIFRTLTGQGDPTKGFVAGIPLQLVLRPYRTMHNGQGSIQYGVSLEFRAESVFDLKKRLIEAGVQFHRLGTGIEVPQIEAEIERPPETPAAIAAEFSAGASLTEKTATPDAESGIDAESGEGPDPDPDDPWADLEALSKAPPTAADSATAGQTLEVREGSNGAKLWTKFYNLCSTKGISEKAIWDELGRCGYERPSEVPESAYPALMKWAESHQPAKQSLF